MRANRTIRPKFPLKPLPGLVFVMKDGLRNIAQGEYYYAM
jgi:hypothetical protein